MAFTIITPEQITESVLQVAKQTQLEKILAWAYAKVGSSEFSGYCQKFVYRAVEAGIGKHDSSLSAKIAREKWMIKGTSTNLKPPAGAAVYFNGTGSDGFKYGHVALSIGDGYILDPVATIQKTRLRRDMNGGYLGWGWEGGVMPTGSDYFGASTDSTSTTSSTNTTITNTPEIGISTTSPATSVKKTVEISTVVIKSETGKISGKNRSEIIGIADSSELFLLIDGDDKIYKPYIVGDIKVTRERTGAPGKMTFSYVDIDGMNISEGNAVAFRFGNKKVFFGYIFTLDGDSDKEKVSVTCYDQLRYFKNKDSFVYNAKYSDMLKNNICKKYGFKTGIIEDTGYKIPTRLEDGSLFDICAQASSSTNLSTGKKFVLYDDFGEICLRDMNNMSLPILIDKDTTGKWTLKRTIDSDVYNRIVIRRDNDETGERELYIANDSETQKKWGVLTLEEDAGEEKSASALKSKAKSMLKYYNRLNQTFNVEKCIGDCRVRGGSSLLVAFDLGNGRKIQNLMIVDKVEHTFSENYHFMDMKLYGGDYTA